MIESIDVSDIFNDKCKDKPDGYYTVREIANSADVSVSTATLRMKKLRENNEVECVKAKIGKFNSWVYKVNI